MFLVISIGDVSNGINPYFKKLASIIFISFFFKANSWPHLSLNPLGRLGINFFLSVIFGTPGQNRTAITRSTGGGNNCYTTGAPVVILY